MRRIIDNDDSATHTIRSTQSGPFRVIVFGASRIGHSNLKSQNEMHFSSIRTSNCILGSDIMTDYEQYCGIGH